MDLEAVRRYGRQIALPEIGVEGQARVLAAEVALVGTGMALETAARYLSGAGVQRFRLVGADGDWPAEGEQWVARLDGATVALRAGFDDDPMLHAAVRLGLPVVVMRAVAASGIDLISFRHHGPCPHAALDVPPRPAEAGAEDGALAVVAGTLAATEVLWRIARPEEPPRARHLRLSAEGEPLAQDIPWAPECFACGGQGRVVVLS